MVRRAFPDHRGRKFSVRASQTYRVNSYELCWSEGHKKEVVALRQVPGTTSFERVELSALSPWDDQTWSGKIPPDVMIVERHHNGARPKSISFILAPDSTFLPKERLSPPPVELSADARIVLLAHKRYTSAARPRCYEDKGLTRQRLDAALDELVERKLISRASNGATAITLLGRNAVEAMPDALSFC
jgi:hypothetical protein